MKLEKIVKEFNLVKSKPTVEDAFSWRRLITGPHGSMRVNITSTCGYLICWLTRSPVYLWTKNFLDFKTFWESKILHFLFCVGNCTEKFDLKAGSIIHPFQLQLKLFPFPDLLAEASSGKLLVKFASILSSADSQHSPLPPQYESCQKDLWQNLPI